MAFKDDVLAVLAGGLPALIETPQQGEPAISDPARPEQTAPEPQLQDREPFFSLQTVTQSQILFVTAGIVGVIGLVALVRRL